MSARQKKGRFKRQAREGWKDDSSAVDFRQQASTPPRRASVARKTSKKKQQLFRRGVRGLASDGGSRGADERRIA